MAGDVLRIEVVFALPDHQELRVLEVPRGTRVADAVESSGLAEAFPDVDLGACQAAIWGNVVEPDRPLSDGDRVELLRPLRIDPREARRVLATEGRFMGGADG